MHEFQHKFLLFMLTSLKIHEFRYQMNNIIDILSIFVQL